MAITSLNVLLFLFLQLCNTENLCKKFGETHTMCLPDQDCNTAAPLTSKQKKEFVELHNKYRQKIAKGEIRYQPRAANMNVVKWNEELSKVAQKWADNCKLKQDKNRLTEEFEPGVGQNGYGESWIGTVKLTIERTVKNWFDQHSAFNPRLVENYKYTGENTADYTQIIWAETTDVGCGYSIYKEKGIHILLVICNYGPTGNVVNSPVYKIGEPCSACPDECSVIYDGLCDLHNYNEPKYGKPRILDYPKSNRNIGFRIFGLQMTFIFSFLELVMFNKLM